MVLDNLHDPLGCLLDTVDKKAVLTIFDLMLNSAGSASDDHRALPHRLGHREAETLPERLLQNGLWHGAATRSPVPNPGPTGLPNPLFGASA